MTASDAGTPSGLATGTPERIVLLGPQDGIPTTASALDRMGISGGVGLITAGWQDWEADTGLIDPALADRATHLRLYAAAERIWSEDPELAAGHRAMQQAARTLRRVYNLRLGHALEALHGMDELAGDPDLITKEWDAAMGAVRDLDLRQEQRVAAIREEYNQRFQPAQRPAVIRERESLLAQADGLEAIVIEGGHVAVLINRLRLLGIRDMLAGRAVIACSGGAMVLAPRLVLFHDSPPQGPGHPEVQEAGLALYPGVLPLPDAGRRLRLDDALRMARFAKRFGPSACVPLGAGTWMEWSSGVWTMSGASRIATDGSLVKWEVAA